MGIIKHKEKNKKVVSYKELMANVDKDYKWVGNILRLYAEQLFLYPTKEEDIIKTDMTDKFLKELEREIKYEEIWKIQINAKMRLSKSTLGIRLLQYGISLLNKYFPEEANSKEWSMRNVARDDQEYTKKMRNPDLMYDVVLTDEENALEQTGENATTEIAQKEVFSNVQAGRYVHNIYVCPEGDMDRNCDIKLEIRNRQEGFIHSYLYYKLKGSWILLGFVDIDVKDLIKNWLVVKKRFYRYLKLKQKEDKEYIEMWSKKDKYVEYMVKKYEKMELMNREGILRPRELDYAGVVLNVVEKVKGLTDIMSLQQIRLPTQSYVEMEFKRQKIPASMIGVEMTTRRVMGVLTMFKSFHDVENRIQLVRRLRAKGKINEDDFNKQIGELKRHQQQLYDLVKITIEELQRYEDVNRKYNSHLFEEEVVRNDE